MSLLSPAWLLLGVVASVVWLAQLVGHRGLRGAALPSSVRALVLGLIALALARPVAPLSPAEPVSVIILDASESVPEAERARALSAAAARPEAGLAWLVRAGGEATVLAAPGAPWPTELEPGPRAAHTDLEAAVEAGLALIPPDAAGRMVLYTDGIDRSQGLHAALDDAAARGVGVSVVALDPTPARGTLDAVTVRTSVVSAGATVGGDVHLTGGVEGLKGPARVSLGEEVLWEGTVDVPPGEVAQLEWSGSIPPEVAPGLAALVGAVGEQEVAVGVDVVLPPRVWVVGVDGRDTRYLVDLLQAEQMQVELRRPGGLTPPDGTVDLVILAGVPAMGGGAALSPAFLAGLRPWILDGGGVIAVGGERAYDLGGWQDSALADVLPVEMDPDGFVMEDAVGLVLALDKSGSMARSASNRQGLVAGVTAELVGRGGRSSGSKMALATDAAATSMSKLRDFDKVGVLVVDTKVRWVVPVQSAERRAALGRTVRRVGAGGGGILVYSTLKAAHEALRSLGTPLRHVLLFADASDVGEQNKGSSSAQDRRDSLSLAEAMAREGITISVIGIGSATDRDALFLRDLAERGGGRFQLTSDPRRLKALFAKDTEDLVAPSLEERPFRPRMERWHPALQGIDMDAAPALRGFNRVRRRQGASVVLAAPDGEPVLASWRLGLGEVVALTTDAGSRWASGWLRWSGYGPLWTQLVRQVGRTGATDGQTPVFNWVDGEARVRLVLRDDRGLSVPRTGLTARATRGEDQVVVPMDVVEPGVWEGRWAARVGDRWTVHVSDGAGAEVAVGEWLAPPGVEWQERRADPERVAALARPVAGAPPRREAVLLWPWLLGLALLLLPLDAYLHRRIRAGAG